MSPAQDRSRVVRRAVVVVSVVVLVAIGWSGFKVWSAWNNTETVQFDTESAREALGAPTTAPIATTTTVPTDATTPESTTTTEAIETLLLDRSTLNTFLILGTDDSTKRADVILMLILPPGSGDAVMVSIPRDLYVPNPCNRGGKTKINVNLFGCEGTGVTGPEQMAVALEDVTGIPIDHMAIFTFPGFTQIIDRVGGVEVCVGPYPVRDLNEDFDDFQLPAGCSVVDGESALAWMRSRRTQQLTDSGWVGMPGVNDFTRNQRQQEMLLTALDKLKQIRSLPELQGLVEDVSNAFIIDENLGLGDAIALLWDARSISSDDIYRVTLDVRVTATAEGESIVVFETPFQDTLLAAYPRAFEFFGWED